jgi:hypothetical protein
LDKFARVLYFAFKGQDRATAAQQLDIESDERINEQETAMKESDTAEKQIDVLLRT